MRVNPIYLAIALINLVICIHLWYTFSKLISSTNSVMETSSLDNKALLGTYSILMTASLCIFVLLAFKVVDKEGMTHGLGY